MWFYAIETILTVAAIFFFASSLRRDLNVEALEKFASVCGAVVLASAVLSFGFRGIFFAGTYEMDAFSQFVKLILALGYFIALLISRNIHDIEGKYRPEYFLFLTTATLGMTVLVSAKDLITLYTGLELSSYSLYLLIPMRKHDNASIEAAIKYLIIGIASTGVMIYGFSLLFGLTQTTYLNEIAAKLPGLIHLHVFWVAFFLSVVAFLFKLSLFPLHAWAPDVYEGGNAQTVGFISTVSKVAGLAVFIRFVMMAGHDNRVLEGVWISLAIASMTLGNLSALIQGDMKRLLAYSSIAQAGYLLVGVLCLNDKGLSAAMFYAAVYVVMNFAAFFVVTQISEGGKNVSISQFRGLSSRSPLLALVLMLALFSLAGVPPLAGFTGKWFLFTAAVSSGFKVVAMIAIINSVISLYYYLVIIKEAYTSPDQGAYIQPLVLSPVSRLFCFAVILVLAVAGFFPGILMPLAAKSVSMFFG
ncbi:MAG: NADH-quinone oxidoreductase subunit N [Candidatus Omnitrophica bacterium]|nr:NADH-quinone oxidoreductase subunit N [Candidatus Omnitrophota bacterium]